jgi:hypothetical protein
MQPTRRISCSHAGVRPLNRRVGSLRSRRFLILRQTSLRFGGMRSVSFDLPSDQTRSFNWTDPI